MGLISISARVASLAIAAVVGIRAVTSGDRPSPPAYRGHEFEALKTRYDDHVVLLRALTDVDLRVFSGYITIQLVFGAWLSTNPADTWLLKIGLITIDLTLSLVAGWLLFNNFKRRQEVVGIVKNLNEALGFTRPGVYLPDRAINVQTKFRPWVYGYFLAVLTAAIGVALIIFAPPARAPREGSLIVPAGATVTITTPNQDRAGRREAEPRGPTWPLQPTTTASPSP